MLYSQNSQEILEPKAARRDDRVGAMNTGIVFACLLVLGLVSTVYCQTDPIAEDIKDLKASNVLVRQRAAAALGDSTDPRAIEALIMALKDRDLEVKKTAVISLGRIGVPAVEPLIVALADPQDSGSIDQIYKVDALAKIGTPAVRPLCIALRNKGVNVRENAGDALAKIGAPAVEPLVAILREERDPLSDARFAAGHALAKIGAPAVEPLVAVLREETSPFSDVRGTAEDALAKIGAPAVEPLVAVLREGRTPFNFSASGAASALAEIGTPALRPLLAALKDPNQYVRENAASALGWARNADALEPLIAALRAGDIGIVSAAGPLGSIKDPRAVEILIAVLSERNSVSIEYAARALGEIGDARAVAALIKVLKDTDVASWQVPGNVETAERAVSDALAKIGAPAVEPLIIAVTDSNSNEPIRRRAARALSQTEDPRAIAPLLAALKKRDIAVIAGAVTFFVRRGERSSEQTLIDVLTMDGDGDMARALLNCGNAKLEAAAGDWARAHGYQVVSLLGRSGPRWGEKR